MTKSNLRAGIAVAALSVAACASTPPKLDTEAQWRDAIGNLGMIAIYPPSEDVMVGDAFLYIPGAVNFDMVRITAAPGTLLARQFCYQEADRLALDTRPTPAVAAEGGKPAVAAKLDGVAGNVECPDSTAEATDLVAAKAPATPGAAVKRDDLRRIAPYNVTPTGGVYLTRLREEAIPILEVGRFSQAEIAGGITSGNIGVALGLANTAASGIRVELRELQSASLEELRASRLIEAMVISRRKQAQKPHRPGTGTTGPDYRNSLTPLMLARSLSYADYRNDTALSRQFCRGEFDQLNTGGARVVVANRVMYAGGVTFNYMSQEVTALRTAIDLASVLANMPQAPKVLDTTTKGGATVVPAVPAKDAPSGVDAELARLMKIANDSLSLTAGGPGEVRARLAVGRYGTLALTREFIRPAAVGMGAALHFPIAEAAVPANRAQIDDVLEYCQVIHGSAAIVSRLEAVLQANLNWVQYLADRDAGLTPVSIGRDKERARGDVPAGGGERTKLRPLGAPNTIRLRL